jgi:hypothetical protein
VVRAFDLRWRSNADMIADIAKLGYLDGHVLDVTWGRGRFWTVWQPTKLTAHDRFTLDGVDFRVPPYEDDRFDVVVLDPPYKLSGTPSLGDFDNRYGVDVPERWQDRMEHIGVGVVECARVTRVGGYLLIKVQDQVCSGEVRWQTDIVTEIAARANCKKVERFDLPHRGRPQPRGRTQKHAHGRSSTLLVFRKVGPAEQGRGGVSSRVRKTRASTRPVEIFSRRNLASPELGGDDESGSSTRRNGRSAAARWP